jgi:hypothetical protein
MVYFDWENGDNTACTVINVNDMCNPEGVQWGDVVSSRPFALHSLT